MNEVYLLLGSNEGDRIAWLQHAVADIKNTVGEVTKQSALYQTAAWGLEEQPDFLNMALCVHTGQSSSAVLESIRSIELAHGRQRTVKWGQRTLDIDILLYNDEVTDIPELTIPHPRMAERRFVLAPLCEIAPKKVHPVIGKTIQQLLDECPDKLEVKLFGQLTPQ